MRQKKPNKDFAKATLAGVRKEMAKPRMTKSVREEEVDLTLKVKSSPSRWR
jgi:hypothetical protein